MRENNDLNFNDLKDTNIPSILKRISELDGSRYDRMPIKRHIFRGCYDVWQNEEDAIKQQQMPLEDLKHLRKLGLAINHPWRKSGEVEPNDCWFITEKGKDVLNFFEAQT